MGFMGLPWINQTPHQNFCRHVFQHIWRFSHLSLTDRKFSNSLFRNFEWEVKASSKPSRRRRGSVFSGLETKLIMTSPTKTTPFTDSIALETSFSTTCLPSAWLQTLASKSLLHELWSFSRFPFLMTRSATLSWAILTSSLWSTRNVATSVSGFSSSILVNLDSPLPSHLEQVHETRQEEVHLEWTTLKSLKADCKLAK